MEASTILDCNPPSTNPPPPVPRFSANLGLLWPERPLLARVDAAAAAGFRAIEVHWPYDVPAADLRSRCERHGLTLLGLNTSPGDRARGEFGLGALPGRERDFAASLDQALAYARESGARAIHCMAGVVDDDLRERAAHVFEASLRQAVALAEPLGLTILVEPLNPRDNPGYFYWRVEEAAAFVERIGSPHLRLQFDCYHVAVAEGDVLTRLRRHFPIVGNVQIAGVPSRAEPDEGEIAYRAIFDELDRLGYGGWVGCEYRPRAGTDEGLRWMRTLGVEASADMGGDA